MSRMKVLALLFFAGPALAQIPRIPSGSTVYIEPMDGYETYLSAAILKKHVPVIVVTDKDKATYIIHSTIIHTQPSGAAVVVNDTTTVGSKGNNDAWNQGWESGRQRAAQRASLGSSSASIAVIDAHSSQIVFAHAAGKMGTDQIQNTAEDCAKHLKEFIEKSEKSKK